MEWNQEIGKLAIQRMQQRASCRVFKEEPIPEDVLEEILKTGIRAATGGNMQPYSIIVVKEKDKNEELARLNSNQQFMGKAPINLIFLLDWYKLSRLAKLEKAPFTAPKSYMHYLIGLEDVICAAQAIETAAWQLGVGSVYIGTSNNVGTEIAEIYNLPQYTYPVVILTLGYPKNELPLRDRLPYELTVFDGKYPELTDEQILKGFEAKYHRNYRSIPTAESAQKEWMERFRVALSTTYSEAEIEEIVHEVEEQGYFKTTQYRFGLHYHAKDMMAHGAKVMKMLKEQGLEPFAMLDQEEE